MCDEMEDCRDAQLSLEDTLSDCMYVCSSECYVLPVPKIPKSIQVPGPTETPSVQSDEQMCLDSNSEQDDRASRPKEYNLLSKPKQLIYFDNQSFNSTTSTVETLSVDSYSTTSDNSEEFTGLVETYHV